MSVQPYSGGCWFVDGAASPLTPLTRSSTAEGLGIRGPALCLPDEAVHLPVVDVGQGVLLEMRSPVA
jgi:hypothetical protein